MKTLKLSLGILAISIASCTPQTESRVHMDQTGQRMSDSILHIIDSSLADPSVEMKGQFQ